MQTLFDQLISFKYELLSLATVLTTGLLIYRSKKRSNPLYAALKNCRLDEKTVVITGANTGLGFETALDLAERGACVILACRDLVSAKKCHKKIQDKTKNSQIFVEFLDLSSFDSVKNFTNRILKKYNKIDILINNAGVMSCPKWTTKDGFDYQLQVNYLSHYLLTRLLLKNLAQSGQARVVNLISKLYETGEINWEDLNLTQSYDPLKAYKQSKLCNILFTNELQNYLEENSIENIQVFSVSPGVVLTRLGRYFYLNKPWFYRIFAVLLYPILWFMFKSPIQGAECTIHCAIKPDLTPTEGFYFRDCKEIQLKQNATNKTDAKRLFKLSESFVKNWL